ncbi:MAG: ubiquinol-cytochrome C chaperone family protein [bacterium]
MFDRFFKGGKYYQAAFDLYAAIIIQGRNPLFYQEYMVDDNVEGRFDMITIHAFLLLRRLRQENSGPAAKLSQKMTNIMFRNMDHSLREMGVGDLTVGKKVRKLAEDFSGRIRAYDPEIEAKNIDKLTLAIARNVYGNEELDSPAPKALADYMIKCETNLESQSFEQFMTGKIEFIDVPVINKANEE